MFGRRKRTHKQVVLDELAESYGHLRLAAAHVAGGTAEVMTPPYDRARNAASRGWGTTKSAFTPLYEQMKEGAANARKERHVSKRKRVTVVVGILAAGAAVGAAGAMVARQRRNAAQWDEYDPMPPVEGAPYTESAKEKVTKKAASMAESVSSQAAKVSDSLQSKSRDESSDRTPPESTPFAGFAEQEQPASKNSRP